MLFTIVVIKHNFIFSSDISFDTINTFFLCLYAIYVAISIVNLLFPEFDGIAYDIVSPFLIPLNTLLNIGNGSVNPEFKLFSPDNKKSVTFVLNIDLLNFSVVVICTIASFTS